MEVLTEVNGNDLRALLRQEVESLKARVKALVDLSEVLETKNIFATKDTASGKSSSASSAASTPEDKNSASNDSSPSDSEKFEVIEAAPEGRDLFGASLDFGQRDSFDPWNEKKAQQPGEDIAGSNAAPSLLFL